MTIPTSYFVSTKNVPDILDRIQRGQVPPRFTYDHLKQLGFPSSNDRPMIPILKALGFLDANGAPQERYRRYKSTTDAKRVMAEGLRDAYSDVFAIDEKAHALDPQEIQGIFARLSEKGESVTEKMAKTFRTLVAAADFSAPSADEDSDDGGRDHEEGGHTGGEREEEKEHARARRSEGMGGLLLRHDVHVHLPVSEDIKVYDAIFRSLRENLLP